MKRVGIYSGTFDPVHIGHVGFALQAIEAAKLDQVVFLPEQMPRDKSQVTDITHRMAMIERTIAPYSQLSMHFVDDVPQFCVQGTLPALRRIFEGDELVLLLGSDVVKTFINRWANLEELFANMTLAIGIRRGDTKKDLKKVLKSVSGKVKPRYVFVDSLAAEANSTRIRDGLVVRDVNPEALEYIHEHHLYGRTA